MPTVSLRRFTTPPLALDVRPLARLSGGTLDVSTPAFLPSPGACSLVLWRPGPDEPSFALVRGELRRDGRQWRFDAAAEGWVVLWVRDGSDDPATTLMHHPASRPL